MRKYRTDISRRENMGYDEATDSYTCAAGKQLTFEYDRHLKIKSGFVSTTSVYRCKDCADCPLKEKCIQAGGSKKPLKERDKVLYVSKRFAAQQEHMEEKINTEQGKLLRVNRSIQAESTFAMVKEDMNFRCFLLCGSAKVEAEWTLPQFSCLSYFETAPVSLLAEGESGHLTSQLAQPFSPAPC